ncbi:MAG: type II toxin-antitoxin system HicB family antitoxin [Methanotrichaceae archaeon]
MFAEYIQAAMERATYEIIDDPGPFYGEVPELQGVWATGKTLEECRKELQSVIEGWIALKLRLGHPIPPIGGHTINVSTEPVTLSNKLMPISKT